MTDDTSQDKLADAWSKALGDDGGEKGQGDLAAEWAAALEDSKPKAAAPPPPSKGPAKPSGGADAGWASAMAADEQRTMQEERTKAALRPQAMDMEFKDMTDIAKAPRPDGHRRELDFILDIPLDVSAELGRTRLLINELLQLGQGSVVELNKLAGEPLEIYVNGKLVARGEAVVINEKFGVRLTDIISPMERVKQLG